jgi:hypothetical protein
MDIFTTQLTRVVPVRIIPEKLEVKALVKDNAINPLTGKKKQITADEFHVAEKKQQNKQAKQQAQEQAEQQQEPEQDEDLLYGADGELIDDDKDEQQDQQDHHLDLFV